MTTLVDGRKLAKQIRDEIRKQVSELTGAPPGLAAVLVGTDPASTIYVRNKHKACREAGMRSFQIELPEQTPESELVAEVARLNADPAVHAILVQLPLPAHIDTRRVLEQIAPEKDVDGLHPYNMGQLVAGRPGLVPCTPRGCLEILDRHQVPIAGAHAVVLGRSDIVGKPVSLLLLHRHATVTLCHSRTRDLPDIVRQADILIAAVGRPSFVQAGWVREGCHVLDVGVNRVDGRVVGDVDFAGLDGKAGLLTPVPGGVGQLTIAMVLANTLQARLAQGDR